MLKQPSNEDAKCLYHPKSHDVKITFLGTGTSQGVPIIGCDCDTCLSSDPRDKRLRSSVLVSIAEFNILIDIGPDFRQQMLTNKVTHLDAVLLTHEHNDHVIGLDDIRPFNFKQKMDMPVFALPRVLADIENKFAYMFEPNPYPGIPRVICHALEYNQPFMFNAISILPIKIMHGQLPILGFRIGSFAYITDASYIGDEEMDLLKDLEVLVINALQFRLHYSHYTLEESIDVALRINAKNTFLTHMSHELGTHQSLLDKLPPNIQPAYDSLVV